MPSVRKVSFSASRSAGWGLVGSFVSYGSSMVCSCMARLWAVSAACGAGAFGCCFVFERIWTAFGVIMAMGLLERGLFDELTWNAVRLH